jgi:hypothetical protein
MKIKRSLKFGSFAWDDATKLFTIEYKGNSIELNKVYAFSFVRFAFSVAQKNWFRKKPNKPTKELELELFSAKIEATSPYNDGWTASHYKERAEKITTELELRDEQG